MAQGNHSRRTLTVKGFKSMATAKSSEKSLIERIAALEKELLAEKRRADDNAAAIALASVKSRKNQSTIERDKPAYARNMIGYLGACQLVKSIRESGIMSSDIVNRLDGVAFMLAVHNNQVYVHVANSALDNGQSLGSIKNLDKDFRIESDNLVLHTYPQKRDNNSVAGLHDAFVSTSGCLSVVGLKRLQSTHYLDSLEYAASVDQKAIELGIDMVSGAALLDGDYQPVK
jgi:hypothetical protein